MDPFLLKIGLSIFLTSAITALLLIPGRLRVRDGRLVLEYSRAMKGVTVFLTLVWMAIAFAACFASEDQQVTAWSVVGCLGIGIVIMVLEIFWVRIEFDQEGLRTFSPWRNRRFIQWSDIERIDYSSILQWHVLRTRKGSVYLHDYLNTKARLLQVLADQFGIESEEPS